MHERDSTHSRMGILALAHGLLLLGNVLGLVAGEQTVTREEAWIAFQVLLLDNGAQIRDEIPDEVWRARAYGSEEVQLDDC